MFTMFTLVTFLLTVIKKIVYHLLGLCTSSEDESDEEKIEMLPWQPGSFSASSDEDNEEE